MVLSALAIAACSESDPGREDTLSTRGPLNGDSIVPTSSGTELAAALLGTSSAVHVTSAKYSGAATAAGTYVDGPMRLAQGAVLTTGSALLALPPNDGPGTGKNNQRAGDPRCDALAGRDTYDAAVLEIHFG